MNWSYAGIMAVAVLTGFVMFLYTARQPKLGWRDALALGLGAFCGGMIGAKLPFVLADWDGFISGMAWISQGKTIVTGLVGAYLGVLIVEWALEIRVETCDRFAAPVAAAIAVGRLACFQGGCCYGTTTAAPWGVDFGDGLSRHPTQLYEAVFHAVAAVVLFQLFRRKIGQGQLIRYYFAGYFFYRFSTEFIRPEQPLWMGLTGYQLASLVLASVFLFWGCPSCRPTRWRRPSKPIEKPPGMDATCHPLKETRTVCPQCYRPVQGLTFERGGRIFLTRDCIDHGTTVSLVSSQRRHYYLRDEVPHGPSSGQRCCTNGPDHKTCVALLEVTQACNLSCPVCYAECPSGAHRPWDELRSDLVNFLANRDSLELLQLSGGEPLLHPEILEIVDFCRSQPVDAIMINTNGLALLENECLAAELAKRKPRLELYLQFDGLEARSHRLLRGVDLRAQKQAVLDRIVEYDLPTTLVCTVAKNVNEDELGNVLRHGLKLPPVRGIMLQPATWAGRFQMNADPLDRLTLADIIRLLVAQSDGLLRENDFKPLPCSDPNCCSLTVLVRRPGGKQLPVTRMIRYEDYLDQLSDRINFDLQDADQLLRSGSNVQDFFRIMIKPFMDAYTYDEDRTDECCVHVIQPGGRAESFCRFNVLARGSAYQPANDSAEQVDVPVTT